MNKLLLIILVALSHAANAGDGHYLKETCLEAEKLWTAKPSDQVKGMYCTGLIKGIVVTMTWTANSTDNKNVRKFGICNEQNPGHFITIEQAIASVLKYIYANPEELNEPDYLLIMRALLTNYPCK
jgi:hypothetical protein